MKISFRAVFLGYRNPRLHQSSTQDLKALLECGWSLEDDDAQRVVRPLLQMTGTHTAIRPRPWAAAQLPKAAVTGSQEETGMDQGDKARPTPSFRIIGRVYKMLPLDSSC